MMRADGHQVSTSTVQRASAGADCCCTLTYEHLYRATIGDGNALAAEHCD